MTWTMGLLLPAHVGQGDDQMWNSKGAVPRALWGSLVAMMCAFPVFAEDLEFSLHNESSYAVVEFYASPYNVAQWEDDILGLDILASGDSVNVTIGDGREQCEYDLRFVFEDGDVVERGAVDLCETGSYTLTD
jgi:hypothetical protein